MDNQAKIACCNACLLAQAMKDCAHCPLNPAKLKLTQDEKQAVNRTELLKK